MLSDRMKKRPCSSSAPGPAGLAAAVTLGRARHRDAGRREARRAARRAARHRREHRDDGAAALLGPRAAGARRARSTSSGARSPRRRSPAPRPARRRGRLPVGRPERRGQPDRARLRAAGRARARSSRSTSPRCPRARLRARGRDRGASRAAPTASTVRAAGGRTIRARYLVAADGIRSTRAGRRSGSRRRTPARLRSASPCCLRGPLWELVGEHRHVIYFLDGEVAAVPMSRPDRWVLGVPGARRRPTSAPALRRAVGGRASTLDVEHVSRDHLRGRARRALPRAQRVPDRRRRPPAHPARRDRDEHRDPRRLRPRLEARVGAARLGRRGAARQLRGRAPPGRRAQRRPRRPTRTAPSAASPTSCTSTSAAASPTRGCRARPGGCRRSTCSATG